MRYLITIILLALWMAFVFLAPDEAVGFVNAGLGGWFMGTLIFKLSVWLEEYVTSW